MNAISDSQLTRRNACALGASFFLSSCAGSADGLRLKALSLLDSKLIYANVNHNAFTDICIFQGTYYLCFRSCPDGHDIASSAFIVVLKSSDGVSWVHAYNFSIDGRDPRDPHFIEFQSRLYIFTGTWSMAHRYNVNYHLGYMVSTTDGVNWSPPLVMQGTMGMYIWRPLLVNDRVYLTCRKNPPGADSEGAHTESWLLSSFDCKNWKLDFRIQDVEGDECAPLLINQAEMLILGRRFNDLNSSLIRVNIQNKTVNTIQLDYSVGGPLMFRLGGRVYVSGRKIVQGLQPITVVWELIDGRMIELFQLPSIGDNGYPGFVPTHSSGGLLSYYSSHGGLKDNTASIYVAKIGY